MQAEGRRCGNIKGHSGENHKIVPSLLCGFTLKLNTEELQSHCVLFKNRIGINVNISESNGVNQEEMTILLKDNTAMDDGPFYHGTKSDLKVGDLLQPGYNSNYGERKKANYVYMTATMDAAIWGAELAIGDEPGRIYLVEPTGIYEDDPNLTDKKFPGNPTRSYRTPHPLRVVGEILEWEGHSPEMLKNMIDHLDKLKQLGIEAIND